MFQLVLACWTIVGTGILTNRSLCAPWPFQEALSLADGYANGVRLLSLRDYFHSIELPDVFSDQVSVR
jgi:hypothetical protein